MLFHQRSLGVVINTYFKIQTAKMFREFTKLDLILQNVDTFEYSSCRTKRFEHFCPQASGVWCILANKNAIPLKQTPQALLQ